MKEKKLSNKFQLTEDFAPILSHYRRLKLSFVAYLGSRSHKLDFQDRNESFITNRMGKRAFIGFNMITKDLKRPEISVLLSDLKEYIQENKNTYYDVSSYIPETITECFLVDINSAYLTVLLNYGIITKNTYNYINAKCNKQERLACVGMLAKRKEVFVIKKGEQVDNYPEEAETRYLFNFCIQEVARAMFQVKEMAPEFFIFYWVDGIYLGNEVFAQKALEYLSSIGLVSKIKELIDFTCQDKIISQKVRFLEKIKGEFKLKEFDLPKDNVFKEWKSSARGVLE